MGMTLEALLDDVFSAMKVPPRWYRGINAKKDVTEIVIRRSAYAQFDIIIRLNLPVVDSTLSCDARGTLGERQP
jgi:hypothetical protein